MTEPEETEPQSSNNGMGGIVISLVVALLGGGGALYYFKFMKSKQSVEGGTDLEDFDFDYYDEEEAYELSDTDEEQEDDE